MSQIGSLLKMQVATGTQGISVSRDTNYTMTQGLETQIRGPIYVVSLFCLVMSSFRRVLNSLIAEFSCSNVSRFTL